MNGYRKELKYIVDEVTLIDVENRIKGIMRRDIHQRGDFYNIRSIYLDTPSYKCLGENEAGISTREKYRIRIYDCKAEKISAEIKIRHNETISKMSVDITDKIVDAIVSNNAVEASKLLNDLKRGQKDANNIRTIEKYINKLSAERYGPAVIVSYERCAYVYPIGNVRITFDRNINASREYDRFYDEALLGRAAIDGNMHVLEIKYDEFLPDEIKSVLSGVRLERSSCSKYARCVKRFI